jgi:hypothetical protein
MDQSMGEDPVPGQEGISVGGQSPDDENGAVLEKTVGYIGTEGGRWSSNGAQAVQWGDV